MTLPAGSMLIPLLLTSDQTCLTNFSGDKKLWHLYMSIGNICSHIRNKPTVLAWILIGLMPIGPKRTAGVKGFTLQQQEFDALTVQHRILERILEPLLGIYEVLNFVSLRSLLLTSNGRQEDFQWLALMRKSGNVFRLCHLGLPTTWKT